MATPLIGTRSSQKATTQKATTQKANGPPPQIEFPVAGQVGGPGCRFLRNWDRRHLPRSPEGPLMLGPLILCRTSLERIALYFVLAPTVHGHPAKYGTPCDIRISLSKHQPKLTSRIPADHSFVICDLCSRFQPRCRDRWGGKTRVTESPTRKNLPIIPALFVT
jgi:hypothetical protein